LSRIYIVKVLLLFVRYFSC